MQQWKKALAIVWTIYSVLILTIILIPFTVDINFISSFIPVCSAKLGGNCCILCGMTTSFYSISRLDFETALSLNRYSLFLYSFFVINSIVFLFSISKIFLKIKIK